MEEEGRQDCLSLGGRWWRRGRREIRGGREKRGRARHHQSNKRHSCYVYTCTYMGRIHQSKLEDGGKRVFTKYRWCLLIHQWVYRGITFLCRNCTIWSIRYSINIKHHCFIFNFSGTYRSSKSSSLKSSTYQKVEHSAIRWENNTVMARSQESTKPARTPGAPKKLAILNALYMPSAVKLKPLFDIQNM